MASARCRYKPGTEVPVGWIVDYRDAHGKNKTKGGFRLKHEAMGWITDLKAEQKAGTFVSPKVLGTKFEGVAAEWLSNVKARKKLKPRTIEGYELILNAHILPKFGHLRIGAITLAQVEAWVIELEATRSPQTVRNIHFCLKLIFNRAVRLGNLKVNPCVGVELPAPKTLSPRKPLTEVQVHQIANVAGETDPVYGFLIRFAGFTGLRKGELLALRVADLNVVHREIYVTASMSNGQLSSPKTSAGVRRVPIPAALWEELQIYLGDRMNEPASSVFNATTSPLVWSRFARAFRQAVNEILPYHAKGSIVFHSLRHTYTTMLEELEVRPKLMSTILGHSTGSVTSDVYTTVRAELLKAVGAKVNVRYLQAANPKAAGSNLSAVNIEIPLHVCEHCGGTGYVAGEEAANG